MKNNKVNKVVNLYPLKKQIILGLALIIIFSFVFQSILVGGLLGLIMTYILFMLYAAKILLFDDKICVSFFLRPWSKPSCHQFKVVEKILFHEQRAAGSSDVIEIVSKNRKKNKYHISFTNKNLDDILECLEGKVDYVLPKSRQPPKYRKPPPNG
ncbi:hypothetical protein [Ulvibacterium marinum]|uniref:hypothetical protein n=1 Tax=Ulvibacterium marinum TaxID=2419782 RepID=UPI0024947F8F|nr:hypothetical protein [Ulvibacterium marinum]